MVFVVRNEARVEVEAPKCPMGKRMHLVTRSMPNLVAYLRSISQPWLKVFINVLCPLFIIKGGFRCSFFLILGRIMHARY